MFDGQRDPQALGSVVYGYQGKLASLEARQEVFHLVEE
jgi:hypothetical protein